MYMHTRAFNLWRVALSHFLSNLNWERCDTCEYYRNFTCVCNLVTAQAADHGQSFTGFSKSEREIEGETPTPTTLIWADDEL